jgi:hypothetical protein
MSDFVDYSALRTAIMALLATIAPTPLITDHMADLDSYGERQQTDGVYTVLFGPREGYNYEHRPGELPKVTIWIYAERLLDGDDPGPAIDAAEDEMIRHFEELAAQAPEQDLLAELVLTSCVPSAQTVTPYASVLATFVYGVDR